MGWFAKSVRQERCAWRRLVDGRCRIRKGSSFGYAGASRGDVRCNSMKSPGSRLWREPGYDGGGGLAGARAADHAFRPVCLGVVVNYST